MGAKLGRCLSFGLLRVYAFDFKEQETEGQRKSLQPSGHEQAVTLVSELTDPPGNPATQVEMMLG